MRCDVRVEWVSKKRKSKKEDDGRREKECRNSEVMM